MFGVRLLAAAICLAALLAALVAGRGRRGALLIVVLAIAWLPLNKPLEGVVLVRVTEDQGLTQADLLTGFALALAAWRWWRPGRVRRATGTV